MIEIQLDAVWKSRNASEGRYVNRASANGMEVSGDGDNIAKLAKALVDAGAAGRCVIKRGDMVVFAPLDVKVWAEGGPKGVQPEWLARGNIDA